MGSFLVSASDVFCSILGQVLLHFADGSFEIAIARLVEGDEQDEGRAILHVQDAILLAGEASPKLPDAESLMSLVSGNPNLGPKASSRPIACTIFARCLTGSFLKKLITGAAPSVVS